MALLHLANELLLLVADELEGESAINALARTNARLFALLNPYLYRHNIQRNESSALFWAAAHGQEATARLSHAAGADVRSRRADSVMTTALHLSCHFGHCQLAYFLVKHGADIDDQISRGHTPLQTAVSKAWEPIVTMLIDHGADFHKVYTTRLYHATPLHMASYLGASSIVRYLLEKGADIEARDTRMQTPLHWAVKANVGKKGVGKQNVETVRLLREYGANTEAKDKDGSSPRDSAKKNPDAAVRMMFQKGSAVALYEVDLHDREIHERHRRKEEREQKEKKERLEKLAADTKKTKDQGLPNVEIPASEIRAHTKSQARSKKKRTRQAKEGLQHRGKRADDRQRQTADVDLRRTADPERKVEIGQKKAEASKEQEMKEENEAFPSISLQGCTQNTTGLEWAQMRKRAESGQQEPSHDPTPAERSCAHCSMVWHKRKGKTQCQLCSKICVKFSFQCPDCDVVLCELCKSISMQQDLSMLQG
ncbi:hypothetical protein MMC28_008187 [Mycoblastus sanguinarius]|nr:hypothetical protein [Mycoblastus sanguinarius]